MFYYIIAIRYGLYKPRLSLSRITFSLYSVCFHLEWYSSSWTDLICFLSHKWDVWQQNFNPHSFFPLCPPLLWSVGHFTSELTQRGWAVQDQPSVSAVLLHARQEVDRMAACNSTWDSNWLTYILALCSLYCYFISLFSLIITLCTGATAAHMGIFGYRLETLMDIFFYVRKWWRNSHFL